MDKRKRTLPVVRGAFIALIAIAALSSAVNFMWFSDIVRESIRTENLGRFLVDGYRRLSLAADSGEAKDPAKLAARQAELAAKSDELAQRVASVMNDSIRAMVFVAVSSFGTVAAGVALSLLVSRRISRPMALLLEANERIAKGNLRWRVSYDAADEMGALADSFNRMAQGLERSVEEIRNQKRTFTDRVNEATAELRALSLTDELTGLPNIRCLREELEKLRARAVATQRPLALVTVDVEDLKAFNHAFGHEAGDLALTAIARSLRAAAREDDFVARYGGVRFAVLMPGLLTVPDDFLTRIEADLASISRLVRHRTDRDIALRIRVGTARFPADGQSLQALVAAADRSAQQQRSQAPREQAFPALALAQGEDSH
jgi:diguanylate cyclase (GGDEF)-like protein